MKNLERIAEHIYLATGYDLGALRTKRRDTFRVAARQLFCYYASLEGYPYRVAGDFVNISYSAALHATGKIKSVKDTDTIIKNYIQKYEIMSRNRKIIEILPPEGGLYSERDVLTGFKCPSCSGRGWHWDYCGRESSQIACPRCSGSGKLRAGINIEWEADV